MAFKLIDHTSGGTVKDTCQFLNQLGLADHVVGMQFSGFGHTVTVFKVPDADVQHVWRKLGKDMALCPFISKPKEL